MWLMEIVNRKGGDGILGISKALRLRLRSTARRYTVRGKMAGEGRGDLRLARTEEHRERRGFWCSVSSSRSIAYGDSNPRRKSLKTKSQMNCGPCSEERGGVRGGNRKTEEGLLLLITPSLSERGTSLSRRRMTARAG